MHNPDTQLASTSRDPCWLTRQPGSFFVFLTFQLQLAGMGESLHEASAQPSPGSEQ